MADEVDSVEAPPAGDDTPGARLRAARKKQGRTTKDIASSLNMDAWMLDAIERDEYSALGAPVFAKGHLKKYALTLGINPDDLMVGYYALAGPREAPPLIADSILRAEAARPASFAWVFPAVVVVAAVIAVAVAALWYLRIEQVAAPAEVTSEAVEQRDAVGAGPVSLALPSSDSGRRSVPLPRPVSESDAADSTVGDEPEAATAAAAPVEPRAAMRAPPADDVEDQPASGRASAAAPRPAPTTQPTAPSAAQSAAAPASLRLTLRFRTDSWVEVYDAERRKMLYGMGEAGSTQNLNGRAPLQVFLGRYSGVDIEVNGEPFTIPRSARRTNTARFRIEQPSG